MSVACPLMDMISLPLHPASANRRHAALRSPCAVQRFVNEAASHHFRKLWLKWFSTYGLPGCSQTSPATASDPPGLLAGITPIGAAQTAATAPNGQGKGPSVFFNSEDQ